MNRTILQFLIPLVMTPIALSGVLINVGTFYTNEPIIIKSFFPNGEDLHLGTFLIFIALGGGILILVLIKVVDHKLKKKEDREYRAGHTGTLPKDWGK